MSISKSDFQEYIKNCNFRHIFNDLGWNNDKTKHIVVIDEKQYSIQSVAEKCGFKIFYCEIDFAPTSDIRKKLDNQIRKLFYHYILILKQPNDNQHWIIPIKKTEKRDLVVINYLNHQVPELLYQKISDLKFTLEQEENLTIVDVSKHVNDLFIINSEKITKQFYEGFKKQHTAFLSFIKGIDDKIKDKDNKQKQWYASLMLNRLMFCYFIQKKDFLDGNRNYLNDKLKECRSKIGKDEFYNFYRSFLIKLFHHGLGSPDNAKYKHLIGKIPYLNGGLFDVHELEKQYGEIDIDDKAFEKIFDFFDEYEWHLDTSFSGSGKEINPDVIGYIFEKYINDRSDMGAYYTKEDITDYISKNSIIPYLFEETQRNYPKVIKKESSIWGNFKESNDAYIYDAVKYGINSKNIWNDLPNEIKKGLNPEQKDLVEIRRCWNVSAPESVALATETWREVIERRNRYSSLISKIKNGEIRSINDFITYNLNIKQFTQDIIDTTDDADFISHFYKSLTKITILDPTCGSGAFLFAALNILEPLYESCIDKMEEFVSASKKGKYIEFEKILSEIKNPSHPNLQYFIYKNIILNNLYGVDIMKEAVEIAKLRLFLKLVATIEADKQKPNLGLEPLPDIDFNIKSGNTLVGFATLDEAIRIINEKDKPGQLGLVYENELDIVNTIINTADELAHIYNSFKSAQLSDNPSSLKKAKDKLLSYQQNLNNILNEYLAFSYGIDSKKYPKKYQDWLFSHQPFHWFAEFYEIIHDKCGFNVIIGNPPYVVYSKSDSDYRILNYKTENCSNLFAFAIEKSFRIKNAKGILGMIIPISSFSTDGFSSLQKYFIDNNQLLFLSNYDKRPAKLFDGAEQRLTIVLSKLHMNFEVHNTKLIKWYSNSRFNLFSNLHYLKLENIEFQNGTFMKFNSSFEHIIYKKMLRNNMFATTRAKASKYVFYYKRRSGYFLMFVNFIPKIIDSKGNEREPSELKPIYLNSNDEKETFCAIFNSTLFWWFFVAVSDFRNLNNRDIDCFNFDILSMENTNKLRLLNLNNELMIDLKENAVFIENNYKNYGKTKVQTFYHFNSKLIIDKIDRVLAVHYGFSEEEIDFIINYDIKYRMSKELQMEEDE